MDQTLTNALAEIKRLAFSGFGLIEGTADEVLWWVVSLSVIMMLLAWFLRPAATPVDATAPWVGFLITLNLVAAFMGVLPGLSDAWLAFMQSVGFYAGGGSGGESLEDVSSILQAAYDSSWALFMALQSVSLYFSPGRLLLLVLLIIVLLGVHFFLVFRLVKLFAEYYILCVLALCCLPFAVLRHTVFLAEGPARYIMSTGVSAAAIAFGYRITHAMVGSITFDPAGSADTYFMKVSAMAILLLVVSGVHEGIRHFMTGSPNTSMGGEARSMVFAASAAAGTARAAMVMGSALSGAATSAARSAMSGMPSGITMNSSAAGGYGGGLAGSMATLSGSTGRIGNGP